MGERILKLIDISIHAPRAGSDKCKLKVCIYPARFQSTLPVRGATIGVDESAVMLSISIHAPRAGSDKNS